MFGYQQVRFPNTFANRNLQTDLLRTDGNYSPHRTFHHHRIRQIDQMNGHGILLRPDGNVEYTGAFYGKRLRLFIRPEDRIGEQLTMIDV